ncbi:hypothetical protein C8J57DRAFT_1250256 [Mycena rebaudengoi]|nr:hypothetical protein C8J57DRAFT_1250256 [Mycena rebaudengoi]
MKLCRRTGKEGKKRGIAIGRQSTILVVHQSARGEQTSQTRCAEMLSVTAPGRRGWEGAGGRERAGRRKRVGGNVRAAASVAGTGGCGDVSRARWRWGREQGTGGFLDICRENPAEMVSGGAGFITGSGGFVAGKVVLQPVLSYGHGRVPAACRVVVAAGGGGFGGGGLPVAGFLDEGAAGYGGGGGGQDTRDSPSYFWQITGPSAQSLATFGI